MFLKFTETYKYDISDKQSDINIVCEWLVNVVKYFELSFNTYFNALIHFKLIIHSISDRIKYQGYASACIKFYSNIFEYEIIETDFLVKICKKQYSENEIEKFSTPNPFNFVSFMTYIGYIIVKLQELYIDDNIIIKNYTDLITSMIMYVTFNIKEQMYVWDVVRYSYYLYKNDLPNLGILNDIDEIKLEHIKFCNSCSYTSTKRDHISYDLMFKNVKHALCKK